MPDTTRLDALELATARLTREVAALREEVQRLRGGSGASAGSADSPGAAASPPRVDPGEIYIADEMRRIAAGMSAQAPRPSRWSRIGTGGEGEREGGGRDGGAPGPRAARSPSFAMPVTREGVEALVGRYGTLALAAFTILMGIGAFVGWAIRNGLIGPELRVALGALASAGVAALGWRLRRGDSPRFGGVLLALALAMMHVVCWGAGPLLHLVPDAVALGVATLASAALAALALREADQSLFNVGFGGALLAPFVTASSAGDPLFLLLYGALVLAAGMRAVGARDWVKTPFVLGAGIAGYTAAASGATVADGTVLREGAPAIFALAMSWLTLLQVQGRARPHLASVALLAALSALAVATPLGVGPWAGGALALVITLTGFAAGAQAPTNGWQRLVGAVVVPLSAGFLAMQGTPAQAHALRGTILAVWFVASAGAAVLNRDGARALHAFSAVVLGGFAIVTWLVRFERSRLLALAAYSATAAVLMRRHQLRAGTLAIFGWLTVATVGAWSLLNARGRWITRPFATPASGVAAAVCAAWLVFSWHWARMGGEPGDALEGRRRTVARLMGAVVTFAWIHTELSHTVSIDVSTFLLVAYYAVSGVAAIGIGRMRSIAALRQVGLALSVLAAVRALVETASMSIGWKVGGYLLAGVFLLGVAYWYRGTGGSGGSTRKGEGHERAEPSVG